MDNKYQELKEQIIFETNCAIKEINEANEYNSSDVIPENVSFNDYTQLSFQASEFNRGMLFAYMSIKEFLDRQEEEA